MKNLSLITILLLLTVLGCRMPRILEVGSDPDAPKGSEQASAIENPATAPTDDPRADVIRTSKKFLDQSQFSATMDGEGKMPMRIELDYQAPDRFHMKHSGASGQVQTETIIIGRDMYMKAGDRWQKLPGALGKTVPQIREFFDEKGLQSLTDVTYVGEDTVDGVGAYEYSYRNEAKKGEAPYPFTSKIWVRKDTGLPAKIEVDYEGGDLRTMTIVYDYDKTVSIEPPVSR